MVIYINDFAFLDTPRTMIWGFSGACHSWRLCGDWLSGARQKDATKQTMMTLIEILTIATDSASIACPYLDTCPPLADPDLATIASSEPRIGIRNNRARPSGSVPWRRTATHSTTPASHCAFPTPAGIQPPSVRHGPRVHGMALVSDPHDLTLLLHERARTPGLPESSRGP